MNYIRKTIFAASLTLCSLLNGCGGGGGGSPVLPDDNSNIYLDTQQSKYLLTNRRAEWATLMAKYSQNVTYWTNKAAVWTNGDETDEEINRIDVTYDSLLEIRNSRYHRNTPGGEVHADQNMNKDDWDQLHAYAREAEAQ